MNLILFDHPEIRQNLLPFTFTRPVAEIRIGILTIREKWEKHLSLKGSFVTENYLSEKFALTTSTDNLWINGAACPTPELTQTILNLKLEETLVQNNLIIAIRTAEKQLPELTKSKKEFSGSLTLIDQVWKIYQHNGAQIR
ncbi:MAG TPA: putative sugar nucleotidyl transferase, partial [Cyclobacteriaceae bacterium]|nr:putative sugar nucleotidyl transferase [Cyclobacteriaceae bacterium]